MISVMSFLPYSIFYDTQHLCCPPVQLERENFDGLLANVSIFSDSFVCASSSCREVGRECLLY